MVRSGDRFAPLSPVTDWYKALWSEGGITTGVSIFLDHFIEEAEVHWQQKQSFQPSSGPFIETVRDQELPFEAKALTVSGRAVLLIQHLGQSFDDQQQLLQAARENLLSQEI